MKIDKIDYDLPYDCFLYVEGEVYEFDPKVAKLWINDKLEILIKENPNV